MKIDEQRPAGKQLYFDRAEIEAWLKRNRAATEEETDRKATSYVVTGRKH